MFLNGNHECFMRLPSKGGKALRGKALTEPSLGF